MSGNELFYQFTFKGVCSTAAAAFEENDNLSEYDSCCESHNSFGYS